MSSGSTPNPPSLGNYFSGLDRPDTQSVSNYFFTSSGTPFDDLIKDVDPKWKDYVTNWYTDLTTSFGGDSPIDMTELLIFIVNRQSKSLKTILSFSALFELLTTTDDGTIKVSRTVVQPCNYTLSHFPFF